MQIEYVMGSIQSALGKYFPTPPPLAGWPGRERLAEAQGCLVLGPTV